MAHTDDRRILVPLDGSEASAGILRSAWPLLSEPGLLVELLGVVPTGGAAPEVEDAEDRLQAALEATAAELRRRGVEVEVQVARGDPASRILARAVETRPELLVMATHGRSGVSRWVRGSVAERVLRQAGVPLFLANPAALEAGAPASLQRILVALDGSPLADRILPHVARVASAFGAEVTLLRVEPFVPREASPLAQTWDPARLRETLVPRAEQLRALGIPVATQAAYGIEAAEILRAAEQADLVALTTHGRSGPSRWWFGSVAEQVLRECTCPLLILRPEMEATS